MIVLSSNSFRGGDQWRKWPSSGGGFRLSRQWEGLDFPGVRISSPCIFHSIKQV